VPETGIPEIDSEMHWDLFSASEAGVELTNPEEGAIVNPAGWQAMRISVVPVAPDTACGAFDLGETKHREAPADAVRALL
jgi:hypothetical protein